MKTDEIICELKSKSVPYEFFENLDEKIDICSYMNKLMNERGIPLSSVVQKIGYERSYAYQFFNGNKTPTRTFLLRFSILLSLSLDETQRLLTLSGKGILYPRIKRDAAVIYVIEHHYNYIDANEFLVKIGVRSLF